MARTLFNNTKIGKIGWIVDFGSWIMVYGSWFMDRGSLFINRDAKVPEWNDSEVEGWFLIHNS